MVKATKKSDGGKLFMRDTEAQLGSSVIRLLFKKEKAPGPEIVLFIYFTKKPHKCTYTFETNKC